LIEVEAQHTARGRKHQRWGWRIQHAFFFHHLDLLSWPINGIIAASKLRSLGIGGSGVALDFV
jgi:hypothetical protein